MEPIVSVSVYETDQLLMRLAAVHGRMLAALARAVADVMEPSSWLKFGYRNCEDFARERLDRNGRWLRRLSALHRALLECPALKHAVDGDDGRAPLRRSAAFEICSVLTADNAPQWIARARTMPVHELRDAVRAERRQASATRDAAANGSSRESPTHRQAPGRDVGAAQPEQPVVYLRIPAPPEAHVGHDEVLDLHGAVVGQNLGVKDFVENLIGEASSGGCIPIDTTMTRRTSPDTRRNPAGALSAVQIMKRRALLECRSRRVTTSARTTSMRRARDTLAKIEEIVARQQPAATSVDAACDEGPGVTHPAGVRVRTLRALIRLEDEIEMRVAQLLVDLAGHAPWTSLGFTGQAQYATERLGWSATQTYRRVRLARKLRRLPSVQAAYENGRVGVEAATWVVRNITQATPSAETQCTWVAHARTTTIKRLRHEDRMLQRDQLLARGAVAQQVTRVHARRRGHGPARGPHAPSGRRCPAMVPITPSVASLEAPTLPSDVAWKSFTGRVPGQARDLVLGLGSQLVERVAVRGALVALPLCFCLPQDLAESFWGCLEAAGQRLLQRALVVAQQSPATEARLAPSERIACLLNARGEVIPHWLSYLSLLEEFVCTWDDPAGMKRGPNDAIHCRDGWLCGAPGCTQRNNLQTHHLEHRAHGGSDAAWNLHDACGLHHLQGEHGELAHCFGRAPLDVVWRLGIPRLATWFRNERRISPPDVA